MNQFVYVSTPRLMDYDSANCAVGVARGAATRYT